VSHHAALLGGKCTDDAKRWILVAEGERGFPVRAVACEYKPEQSMHAALLRADRSDYIILILRAQQNLAPAIS
jgi:hypothetical protein